MSKELLDIQAIIEFRITTKRLSDMIITWSKSGVYLQIYSDVAATVEKPYVLNCALN